MAQVFRNATGQTVTLAPSSPPVELHPGQKVTLNFTVPRYGDIDVLTDTIRFVDEHGSTVFCRRISYGDLINNGEVVITAGVNECD